MASIPLPNEKVFRPKSIMQFYGERKDGSGENQRYKCNLCSSDISSSKKATSNLVKHVQRKHAIEYAQYKMEPGLRMATTYSPSSAQPNPATASVLTKTTPQQLTEYDFRQMSITSAVVQVLAGNCLPLSTVDNEDFRRLIHQLDPRFVLPSRRDMTDAIIPQKRHFSEEKLRSCFRQQQDVCLALDLWSNRRSSHSFLSVTGHFIDNWHLRSAILACRRFESPHNCETIIHLYEEIIQQYQLTCKVKCIITDNVATRMKAFDVNLPGFDNIVPMTTEFDDDDCNNASEDDLEVILEDGNKDLLHHMPLQLSCFTYTLHRVVKDGLKDCRQLECTLGKLSLIVNSVRLAPNAIQILGDAGRVLQTKNGQRWNRQLKMVRAIMRIPEDIFYMAFNSTPGDGRSLTALDRAVVSELLQVLEPFEDAMDFVEAEQKVTISSVLPSIRGLKAHLEGISARYCSQLVARLIESIDTRLNIYEKSEVFILGAILDPRFKLAWCTPEEVETYKNILRKELISSNIDNSEAGGSCGSSGSGSQWKDNLFEVEAKRPKLFNFMAHGSQPSYSRGSKEEIVNKELTKYFGTPCVSHNEDPLLFWHKSCAELPLMAKLAQSALAVCVSSTSVERVVSIAGKFARSETCSVSDDMFESLMLIKCNNVM